MKPFDAIKLWVDGEKSFPLKARQEKASPDRAKKGRRALNDEQSFNEFIVLYKVLALIISIFMLALMLMAVIELPSFGDSEAPTNNIVVERYVGMAEHETGAENVIAGMILNYRGFDTFGESCVLFLAVCCVMLLLWGKGGVSDRKRKAPQKGDAILSGVCRLLFPCVLVFGICILFNGHISPGGGFSGGSVLGAALILFAVAFGADAVQRFFTRKVFNLVRISGLMIYAVLFFIYIYLGANGIESELSRYIVLVVDLAVGLVVMSTMYGFYSFYTKGDL